jgi:anti-sigma factor RsiW
MMRPLESEFHALADGRLSAQRAAQVRAWLDQHPDDAAKVHAWQRQRESLHALFDPVLDEPVPIALQRSAMPRSWRQSALPKIAASLLWLALGAAAGFFARGMPQLPGASPSALAAAAALPREAAIAHAVYTPEVRHPVEVGADQEAHLVQWLSKRLGTQLVIPDLNRQGFALVGGRLLATDEGPAAQFMYQDVAGNRLTLYVRHDGKDAGTAFRFASEGDVGVFYWVDGAFGYALSGKLGRERLLAAAQASHRQLGGQ